MYLWLDNTVMNVSILQWNIWYREDVDNILKLLLKVKPDIFCLQELTTGHPIHKELNLPDFIAAEFGYSFCYKEIPTEENQIKLANGIFSKYPIASTRYAWINEQRGKSRSDNVYRVYVEATIDINSKQLTVGTTQMSYTKAFQVTPRKIKETKRLVNLFADKKEAYILTGDFNAQPDSEVIEMVRRHLINAGPDFKHSTWTTKPFSYDGFEASTLDWRLDYIFTTPDLRTKASKIIETEYSGHLPVYAEIEL